MNIIADENIPFAQKLFSQLGEVELIAGRSMTREDLVKADVLLTRSVTKVGKSLLDNTPVKFVGTCTIGTDHIDQSYLAGAGVGFASAPGCNALGVVQYDICALAHLGKLDRTLRYAVIGCGNVGSRVYKYLKAFGFDCVGVDPHLDRDMISDLVPFEEALNCDVICMHTPLVRSGAFPTESLIGAKELSMLKPGCTLLNAGRGECIDNLALLSHLQSGAELNVVLDVWANEPSMNPELFKYVKIGTPHIAGYSFEGRVNGSTMIFEALASYLAMTPEWISDMLTQLRDEEFGPASELDASSISELVLATYNIAADHENLAAAIEGLPKSFDFLRKNYYQRREFSHYKSINVGTDSSLAKALGFQV